METPGEDPYLNGQYGAMYSIGLQVGSDSRYLQGITTLKHFDANSLEGSWFPNGTYNRHDGKITRHTVDANISMYDLASSYFPAFRASVVQGHAAGVMCSYNSINGVPSCANDWLLNDVLRGSWGFDGYVTSDSGAVVDIKDSHHYVENSTSMVATAIKAGTDVESAPWPPNQPWSTGSPYINYSAAAIAEGLMSEADLDKAVSHALKLRFKLGLFDPIDDQPYWHVSPDVVRSASHEAEALDATSQSLVLLKNDGVLPIDDGASVAVIGPLADDQRTILG